MWQDRAQDWLPISIEDALLEIHSRYKSGQSMWSSPQSVVVSGQRDNLEKALLISNGKSLLIAAISVSEVRSKGEPAKKVDE